MRLQLYVGRGDGQILAPDSIKKKLKGRRAKNAGGRGTDHTTRLAGANAPWEGTPAPRQLLGEGRELLKDLLELSAAKK